MVQLLSDFDFDLSSELIAEVPLPVRSGSRMMVIDRISRSFEDKQFKEVASFLRRGDVLVLNNTKVFPARLFGRTETGTHLEVFLVKQIEGNTWEVLAKPGRRLKVSKRIFFDEGLSGTVVEKHPEGTVVIGFEAEGDLDATIDSIGKTPLPPYIHRRESDQDTDRERYQTVYASERGAIAAPTAGLHFTPELLDEIRNNGVIVTEITLHVGYGTFEPVRTDEVGKHRVATERYGISEQATNVINEAMDAGRRVVAVGTTTTRALESCFLQNQGLVPGPGIAELTITPGYKFNVIGALLTNFHLPRSSLLILVSTFAGHELIMKAYEHAIAERYRFYSYGDCMLIV